MAIPILLIALVAPLAVGSNATAKTDVTDLGPGVAWGINEAGQVVGNSHDGPHAFLWQDGTRTEIGAPPGDKYSSARDINDAGQIAGYSIANGSVYHGFFWENGTFTDLGTLDGATPIPEAINNAGQVVGNIPGHPQRAFLWEDGNLTDLGGLSGFGSAAHGINDAGWIVGQSYNADHEIRAVLWRDGTVTDLGWLPGDTASAAYGINAKGQIAGYSYNMYRGYEAVLWENGTITDLGNLPETNKGWAHDINEAGQIIGYTWGPEDRHIVIWHDGVITDLGQGFTAYDLNEAGQAVGGDGNRALLWTIGPGPLAASPSATPAATDVGMPISFACRATGGVPPFEFSWDFGDGQSSSGANATHAYATPGTKLATCSLTDQAGGQATASIEVLVNPAPSVIASANPAATSPGLPIRFASIATGGTGTYAFEWAFGDGSSGTGASVTHAYASTGAFVASVTAIDQVGASAVATVEVTVAYLAATISGSSTATHVDVAVSFACAATGGTGPRYEISWSFDDGSRGSGVAVSHAYSSVGKKTVTCTVTDAAGTTATTSMTVMVYPIPAVTASVTPPRGSPGVPLTFTAEATGGAGGLTYDWDFGDGGSETGRIVTHAYQNPGQYHAVLMVQDSGVSTAPITVEMVVMISSIAGNAIPSTTSAVVGEVVTFSAMAEGGAGEPYTFSWDFGDGTNGTGADVSHVYRAPGSYTPRLTVTDAAGASEETLLETITVHADATGPSGFWAMLPLVYLVGGIVVLAIGVALATVLRRRNGR